MEAIDIDCEVAGDLSTKQYYFVAVSGTASDGCPTVAVCTAETDRALGVLQDKPSASGQKCRVRVFGETLVASDEALTYNDPIGTQDDGQAQIVVIGTDTTVYLLGRVTRASTAVAGYARAFVNCINPPRAA